MSVSWGQNWASTILENDPLIIDFETTGFKGADIVQIGILNATGEVLMDQLVKPSGPIPAGASAVNGIYDHTVVNAPEIHDVFPQFIELVQDRVLVAYNSDFEVQILSGVQSRYRLSPPARPSSWNCAMKAYARFKGERQPGRRGYRWHKLTLACQQQGIQISNAHRAIGDCKMTLALLYKMAASSE